MAALTTVESTVASPITDLAGQLVAAESGGDTAEVATSGLFFVMSNGDAGSHTATIATPGSQKGLAIADATLVVEAGEIGLIPLDMIFRGSTGRASITYDAVTSVTVGVIRLGV